MTSLIGLGGFHCQTLNHAFYFLSEHLSNAELSGDLREALLNTGYVTVLTKFQSFNYKIPDLLEKFLSFLRFSVGIQCTLSLFHQSYLIYCLQTFTDTEDLYLHHRNIYDSIMCQRIADVSLNLGSFVGLAIGGLRPDIQLSKFNKSFTAHFPAVEGGLSYIYQKLYFHWLDYQPYPYSLMLTEFLTDPGRAGEHALDGTKCALVTKFLLDCFISPCSERNFVR